MRLILNLDLDLSIWYIILDLGVNEQLDSWTTQDATIVNDTPYTEYLFSTNTVVYEIILTAISFSNSL